MKSGESTEQGSCNIEEQRAFKALYRLYDEGHLPQAILLLSNDPESADGVVNYLANKLLNCDDCRNHMDFFTVGPNATSSQIVADDIRSLITNIQSSPKVGQNKVAYVQHAESMNKYAANSFLMTLEEPPADTTIFLSTVNKYDLLPTILSRCIVFKLHSEKHYSSSALEKIANMYESWLNSLNAKTSFNLAIIEMYKILSCIEENFDAMADEMGMAKPELLKVLVACLEQKTAEVFKGNQRIVLKLHNGIKIFEKNKCFLSINCNIIAYLETCFILLTRFFERNLNKSCEYDNGY
ncbi:MAG: hypothetical protein LBF42_01605 [Puniceicoccales bacterium]|jgi:DNA polymerase III delta prime subunit|nr:hypothetical protein [Puniceicoccales bacterium]